MDREYVVYIHILNIQPVSSVFSKNRKEEEKVMVGEPAMKLIDWRCT